MNTVVAEILSGVLMGHLALFVIFPLLDRTVGRLLFGNLGPRKATQTTLIFDVLGIVWGIALRDNVLAYGFATILIYDAWSFWNRDDNGPRRQRVAERIKGVFRSFAPSPIPAPGAA